MGKRGILGQIQCCGSCTSNSSAPTKDNIYILYIIYIYIYVEYHTQGTLLTIASLQHSCPQSRLLLGGRAVLHRSGRLVSDLEPDRTSPRRRPSHLAAQRLDRFHMAAGGAVFHAAPAVCSRLKENLLASVDHRCIGFDRSRSRGASGAADGGL